MTSPRFAYINLDSAVARRDAMEREFARSAPLGAILERFIAVPAEIGATAPGNLKPPEKACFLSHQGVIEQACLHADPIVVLEDDVTLSPKLFEVIPHLLGRPEWDVIYLNLGTRSPTEMMHLARARERLGQAGQFGLLNAAEFFYFGAAAYVVPPKAKPRLAAALREATSLDAPFDLYLRKLVREARISAAVVLPFLSGFAPTAYASQIQERETDRANRAMGLFRDLLFVDRDLNAARDLAAGLMAQTEDVARLYGAAFAVQASRAWPV